MEIWKTIKGFEDYKVSNFGNVKSFKNNKELILKTQLTKKGYKRLSLSNGKIQKHFLVHQLVAIYFLGHKPNGMENVIDHIDNDKQNNNVSNLRIVSNRENCSKDKKNKTSKYIGVSFDKSRNKWVSEIRNKEKRYRLGRFNSEYEAYIAYQKKLKEIENE